MAVSKAVDITYVPADCGSVIYGKSKAPAAFKEVSIAKQLKDAGVASVQEHEALSEPATWRLTDFPPGGVRNEALNVEVCDRVRETLSTALANDSGSPPFQLVLGGECCMLPGIMSAFWAQSEGRRVGLIYIDADTDLNAPSDPKSTGNLAAQTMTHLVGAPGGLESLKGFSRSKGEPLCDASNTVFFGLNMSFPGNKSEHFAYLYDKQYRVIPSSAVATAPKEQAATALKYFDEQGVDTIIVHLDVDAIDPGDFPLANLPNYTGVKFRTMMEALAVMLAHSKVAGLCVAEVNPDHDPGLHMTRMLSASLAGMLGSRQS
jgi:arginase